MPVPIPKVTESECPVSAITHRSHDLVLLVNSLLAMESPIPIMELPGYLYDAIRVIKHEASVIDSAQDEMLYSS